MKPLALQLSADARRTLDLAVRRAHHREACGLCLGSVQDARLHVETLCLTRNSTASATSFSIDCGEWRRASRVAQQLGLAPVALFHSHPDGSVALSEADRRGLLHSTLPWLVAGRHLGRLRVALYPLPSGPRQPGQQR